MYHGKCYENAKSKSQQDCKRCCSRVLGGFELAQGLDLSQDQKSPKTSYESKIPDFMTESDVRATNVAVE